MGDKASHESTLFVTLKFKKPVRATSEEHCDVYYNAIVKREVEDHYNDLWLRGGGTLVWLERGPSALRQEPHF